MFLISIFKYTIELGDGKKNEAVLISSVAWVGAVATQPQNYIANLAVAIAAFTVSGAVPPICLRAATEPSSVK